MMRFTELNGTLQGVTLTLSFCKQSKTAKLLFKRLAGQIRLISSAHSGVSDNLILGAEVVGNLKRGFGTEGNLASLL